MNKYLLLAESVVFANTSNFQSIGVSIFCLFVNLSCKRYDEALAMNNKQRRAKTQNKSDIASRDSSCQLTVERKFLDFKNYSLFCK